MLGFGRRYLTRGRRRARAVGLVVLSLCLAAIAIDGARLLVEQRHLQNAVDAAALAAARDLPPAGTPCSSAPGCPQAVSQDAMAYSDANGGPNVPFQQCSDPSATDCYVTPYDHNPKVVQVRITETPKTFFLGELGLTGPVTVSSSAGAGSAALGTVYPSSTVTNVSGGSNAALFASDTSCDAIDIESTAATFNGAIRTNGGIKTHNSSYVFNGPLSYHPGAQTPPCSAPDGSFNSGVETNHGGNSLPKRWNIATLCAATHNTFTVATSVPSGASGVWCSSVSLTDDQKGAQSITLIAPKVTVSGTASQNLTASPAGAGLLIDVTGNSELDLRARGAVIHGDLVAPLTTIKIDGANFASGFFEAKDIVIGPSPLDLTGDGPLEGATTTYTTVQVSTGISALGASVGRSQ